MGLPPQPSLDLLLLVGFASALIWNGITTSAIPLPKRGLSLLAYHNHPRNSFITRTFSEMIFLDWFFFFFFFLFPHFRAKRFKLDKCRHTTCLQQQDLLWARPSKQRVKSVLTSKQLVKSILTSKQLVNSVLTSKQLANHRRRQSSPKLRNIHVEL